MNVIGTWTGREADGLRQALRMTNEAFAEYLGVAVRTVADWRQRPDIVPRPAMQEVLDTALDRAPDRVKARFSLLLQADQIAQASVNGELTQDANGLSREVLSPDDEERLIGVVQKPSRLDAATVEDLGRSACQTAPYRRCPWPHSSPDAAGSPIGRDHTGPQGCLRA